ncbi:MAG: FAD-dependent oxidoreductase [Anaerolineales bacterium]|nr:FAD-dependent oxidoreductase [Anaerolineales bacterium]
MYDLAIIGGGPAALSGAVYAGRKRLNTVLITKEIGGQLLLTSGIENYLGFESITGAELADKFANQMAQYDIDEIIGEKVVELFKQDYFFKIRTEGDQWSEARAVILASGKRSRTLNVPGERELTGRGVAYCATCDAPLFAGRKVAVIGGGNSAFEAVIDLLPIATEIFLIDIAPHWFADQILIDRIEESPKVKSFQLHRVVEILGERRVSEIVIEPIEGGEIKQFNVQGVFVEIGLVPNSEFVEGLVKMNQYQEIIVDCHARTNVPGLFAAGDVTDVPEKQVIISAGEGAKAALSAYRYLIRQKGQV